MIALGPAQSAAWAKTSMADVPIGAGDIAESGASTLPEKSPPFTSGKSFVHRGVPASPVLAFRIARNNSPITCLPDGIGEQTGVLRKTKDEACHKIKSWRRAARRSAGSAKEKPRSGQHSGASFARSLGGRGMIVSGYPNVPL